MNISIAPPRRRLNRKGIFATAASIALLATISGCSQVASSATPSSVPDVPTLAKDAAAVKLLPAAIATRGVLRVAIPTDEPPTQFYQAGTQHMTGINPDIARLIGEALGIKVDIAVANFDAIIPGFAAGRYDVTVSSMTPTHARMKVLNFVDYMRMGSSLSVASGNPLHLTFRSLCGHPVALLSGSYELAVNVPDFDKACTAAGKAGIHVAQFQDTREAISALTSSRVDAVFADSPILGYAAKQNSSIEVASTIDNTPVSVGISKDPRLLKAVSTALAYLITTKQYKEALGKYGLGTSAITDARVNFAQG
jgi:polar amino acid transport system substrate-binding protein